MGELKTGFSGAFQRKTELIWLKKFKLLRIRSKLWKSGAYWGHWSREQALEGNKEGALITHLLDSSSVGRL
jgi:hypothetical protein